MSILEEFMGKAKAAADIAGKKTSEIVEISKLKLQITQLNSEVDKSYSRLGALVYESLKNSADAKDVINVIVAEIDELNSKIQEAEGKINELKNVVKCANCGMVNNDEAVYCSRCGEMVVNPKAEKAGFAEQDHEEPVEENHL